MIIHLWIFIGRALLPPSNALIVAGLRATSAARACVGTQATVAEFGAALAGGHKLAALTASAKH